MFDEANICPYTGLRSFAEDESIYFKGRDQHIEEATGQLENNKFLMLTGASGDGKSSLVYAGIIPNARAGFLKAKYTNWAIADFRPERDPFNNLSSAISQSLNIQNHQTTKAELGHGFSALVDLYKSSEKYIDEDSLEWLNGDEEKKRSMQRKSANLLILVDQFEEFFTNLENYMRGATSNDANLVMNLLLETARQALDDDLPIYIVCTMRSDFIGQCAAFRGLPEYIGFSQFFVPRLNRMQLQEVIEEPAVLSGNTISRRLTERLIHDVIEGVDQLPILQHALNQIWKAADQGNAELDLIHYAMVGGMPESELPADDQVLFRTWFSDLPKVIQECYHKPGLQKVLDTHANKIYISAGYEYKKRTGKTIDDQDAYSIIRTTFTCLTKIDESRAVRNRMTLDEITQILDNPKIDATIVSEVIAIFRQSGNTFIKPFISEDEEASALPPDTVLDITHESLIRNWEMLEIWAKEEFDKFMILKDFKQQVDRWLEYDKSWGFLLPIGSLTYFEEWFRKTNPNPHWVNRYNELVTDTAKNLDESKEIVTNSRQFLKRSNQKHAVTRAVMRFGPKRIGAVLGVIAVLVLSSFVVYDKIKRQNEFVFGQAIDKGEELLNSEFVTSGTKAEYLIGRERLERGSLVPLINSIENQAMRLEVVSGLAYLLASTSTASKNYLAPILFQYADDQISTVTTSVPAEDKTRYLAVLIEIVDSMDLYALLYNKPENLEISQNTARVVSEFALDAVEFPRADINIKELNEAIEVGISHKSLTLEEIDKLLSHLSPWENTSGNYGISSYYARERSLVTGMVQQQFTYNGLYQLLGELYGAIGNAERAMQSVDTLFRYNSNYEDYTSDAYTIGGAFIRYGQWEDLDSFYQRVALKFSIEPYKAYRRTADRLGHVSHATMLRSKEPLWSFSINLWVNPILEYMPDSLQDVFYARFLRSIEQSEVEKDEKEFALAMYYKQRGTYSALVHQLRLDEDWHEDVHTMFDQSIVHYQNVSESFMNEQVQTFLRLPVQASRKEIYYYPDYREIVQFVEQRSRFARYHSDAFLQYILENEDLFAEFYATRELLELIPIWINEYKNAVYDYDLMGYLKPKATLELLLSLHNKLEKNPLVDQSTITLLKFIVADRLFEKGEIDEGVAMARSIDHQVISNVFREEFVFNLSKSVYLIGQVYGELALNHQAHDAANIMEGFEADANKIRLYDHASIMCFEAGDRITGQLYLDSAQNMLDAAIALNDEFFRFEVLHAYALCFSDDQDQRNKSFEYSNELNSFFRVELANRMMIMALVRSGDNYASTQVIPKPSPEEELIAVTMIIQDKVRGQDRMWGKYDQNMEFLYSFNGFNYGF